MNLLLRNTKNAKLVQFVPRKPGITSSALMKVREKFNAKKEPEKVEVDTKLVIDA